MTIELNPNGNESWLSRELVKTDKNGSKYYVGIVKCWKCDGRGIIPEYHYQDGGVCYKCEGAKVLSESWVERTPEYEAKLAERREKRHQAKEKERMAKVMEIFPEGKMWLILGNTYNIKEQIKADGGRFNNLHGWYFTEKKDGYQLQEVDIKDAFMVNIYGTVEIDYPIHVEKENFKTYSEYVGEIGQKLEMDVTFIHEFGFEIYNRFNRRNEWMSIYQFKDEDDNILVWKTQSYQDLQEGTKYHITGTVSNHEEYKDNKQTVLKRVKIK